MEERKAMALSQEKLEDESKKMDGFQKDLKDLKELDPIESPACIIGKYFIVSS
ncbi:MAG: hypothetical protein LKJ03_09095 [Enterococcaceae bacterium]|jgi:hypothetical protein|nr:hypothetical protein [Enterococcaceae bacterium]